MSVSDNEIRDSGGSAGDDTSSTGAKPVDTEPAGAAPPEPPVAVAAEVKEALPAAPTTPSSGRPMQWYVLRVASNREEQVCEALTRKVKIEHLEERVGRILVPTQREKRMRSGVARVYDRKLYPGYVFVEMAPEEDGSIAENVWFVIKETMSVGDFIGSDGKPTPMKPHDVEKMLAIVEKSAEQPTLAGMAGLKKGDAIKVKEGPFENFEGEIDEVFPDKGHVRVIVTIFGRPTPIELEYWQVEAT
ncbi:MAG TPA: transcription termination/antitermination protein NusG [Phycisphaerae bacterium]|nr:transcription termination/antitermination protein NusG [Phycisphaerae bacterium]